MQRLIVAALVLGLSCTRQPRPSAPDAGAPRLSVVDAGPPARLFLPDAGFHLVWNQETHEVPQVVRDGAPLTAGNAHYLQAVADEGLYVTRVAGAFEQLVLLSADGGARPVGPPSSRSRQVTAARGHVLFESGAQGLSHLSDGVREVITDEAGSFEPSLAPDATWFAFVSSRDGDAEVYRAALDGGAQQRLTAFHLDDVAPRVSPDGKWVLFVSNREGEDRLFLVRADGRGTRRLHHAAMEPALFDGGAPEGAEADASWSCDGRAVLFSARARGGRWHLFRADVENGTREQLTFGPFDDRGPVYSPDCRWIAFVSTRDADPELYVLNPEGTPQRVTEREGADWQPRWQR